MKKVMYMAYALITAVTGLMNTIPSAAQTVKEQKAFSYNRAKEIMSPDLYLVFRVADRIITTNEIKRPIRVAVRNNVDCVGMLGLNPNSAKCAAIELLPQIDKATNFEIWAAQVVGTMNGQANAFAYSGAGTIYLNIAMLKELTGKIDQVACVVGHELAHVTQNHGADKFQKQKELDIKTSLKISDSVQKGRNSQNAYIMTMAILGGVSAGLGGDSSAATNAINNLGISAMLLKPEIAAMALEYSEKISEAINGMKGLAPNFAAGPIKAIDYHMRNHSLEFAGFSRTLEYEADLLGLDYVAVAGFNTNECKKLWTETMNHNQNKLIKRLLPEGTEDPGVAKTSGSGKYDGKTLEEIQKEAFEKTIANKKDGSEKKEDELEKVPDDVMESLKSHHPDGLSRASAIDKRLRNTARFSNLTRQGKARLSSVFVRDWNYDEQSDSVIISDTFVNPKQAGSIETGTTGIDVDKSLDF